MQEYCENFERILLIYLCMSGFFSNFALDMQIDTKNMCSYLQRKLFDAEGVYYAIREEIEQDDELTAVVRSRQLHINRNGKKILVLAGKSAPKIIREDKLNTLL